MALPLPSLNVEVCDYDDRLPVCSNRILSEEERNQEWFQRANLYLGAGLLIATGTIFVVRLALQSYRKATKTVLTTKTISCSDEVRPLVRKPPDLLKAIKTFHICPQGRECSCQTDLHILPQAPGPRPPIEGRVEYLHIDAAVTSVDSVKEDLAEARELGGVVLRVTDNADDASITAILTEACSLQLSVILMCDHDYDRLSLFDIGVVHGIIIENACILRTGQRRDYFRSAALRECMTKCNNRRAKFPSFFIGFYDVWDQRPSAAVIKRAAKLSEHFAAVIFHGPAPESIPADVDHEEPDISVCLSALQVLRSSEPMEVQSAWLEAKRQTYVPRSGQEPPKFASLNLEKLAKAVPKIGELLAPMALPQYLLSIQNEPTHKTPVPSYVVSSVRRDFWEYSFDNEPLATVGCFPITVQASNTQAAAVMSTQHHLKEINMLHEFTNTEIHAIIETFKGLKSGNNPLVLALIDGIRAGRIHLYKGLHTGFTLPGGATYFWGVSSQPPNAPFETDIFISKKCPDDAAVILHTWLAHNGVPRLARFEEEVKIHNKFQPSRTTIVLPITVQAALEEATESELLLLLQQLRMSGDTHIFRPAIERKCSDILLKGAATEAWKQATSQGFLEGTISMKELIKRRLSSLSKEGASALPLLENMVSLFEVLTQIIEDALLSGNREILDSIVETLLHAYDPWNSWTQCKYVDINSELVALLFFGALRKAALDEVYIEATDRCPFFLSQPDQAAVFSELWVLGSQCEPFFGMPPRDVGAIIFKRYEAHLRINPPPADAGTPGDWSAYMVMADDIDEEDKGAAVHLDQNISWNSISSRMSRKFVELGAMSIFCLPAIIDVILLSILGRGFFMSAFMNPLHLQTSVFALLMSLLLTAGVTGWVGAVGNYYLAHFAYDNMALFHVERLAAGFILTILIALVGFTTMAVQVSPEAGGVFVAYVILLATYMNVLGIMATMHQHGSPLLSGRTVIWRTVPLLFAGPIITTFVREHDLLIYLLTGYIFLIALLWQYRWLCRTWSSWIQLIPKVSEKEIKEWQKKRAGTKEVDSDTACEEFYQAIQQYNNTPFKRFRAQRDPLVARTAMGLPYAFWLLKKEGSTPPKPFSAAWFPKMKTVLDSHQQLIRGLKGHSIFFLFRLGRQEIGINLALFLIALMDRWVNLVMSSHGDIATIYVDKRARYAICLGLFYFSTSVMLLDETLQGFWEHSAHLSKTKLNDLEHVKKVDKAWERVRRGHLTRASFKMAERCISVFGVSALFLWLLVDNGQSILIFYLYVIGYTGVIVFQFNRCFTTNTEKHIASLYIGIGLGLATGVILRLTPPGPLALYYDVIAMNVSSITAAVLTSILAWRRTEVRKYNTEDGAQKDDSFTIWRQNTLLTDKSVSFEFPEVIWKSMEGIEVSQGDGTEMAKIITEILKKAQTYPNHTADQLSWSAHVTSQALSAWNNRKVSVLVVPVSQYRAAGLDGSCSASRFDGKLRILGGYLDGERLLDPIWRPMIAEMITESILYHTAIAVLGLPEIRAVQAEHFVHEAPRSLSRRLDLELGLADSAYLETVLAKSNADLMKHLCLEMNVDTEWVTSPADVRKAIVSRVLGKAAIVSAETKRWMAKSALDVETCDYQVKLVLNIYRAAADRYNTAGPTGALAAVTDVTGIPTGPGIMKLYSQALPLPQDKTVLQKWASLIVRLPVTMVKWIAIISGGDSDVERELWFILFRAGPLHHFLLTFLLALWKACWLWRNFWVEAILLWHRPTLTAINRLSKQGAARILTKDSIIVEFPRQTVTGFFSTDNVTGLQLDIFDGRHNDKPTSGKPLSTAIYGERNKLSVRTDHDKDGKGRTVSTYKYEDDRGRKPFAKQVQVETDAEGTKSISFCHYDKFGRVAHGQLQIENMVYEFQYSYKAVPKGSCDLICASYHQLGTTENKIAIFWGVPLQNESKVEVQDGSLNWVTSQRLCKIERTQGDRKYVTRVDYQHRRHPKYETTLFINSAEIGNAVAPPKIFPHEDVLLKKPTALSFEMDDLLLLHSSYRLRQVRASINSSSRSVPSRAFRAFQRSISFLSKDAVYSPVPTWQLRTKLWQQWLNTKGSLLDAAIACHLDELILRQEPLLRPYWKFRDFGRLEEAKNVLDLNLQQIICAIEIDVDVAEMCMLPIKMPDLYAMGLGKDATEITYRPVDCVVDSDSKISVIVSDIGCWPEAPGGVSNCRRDLVNGHSTIQNHVLAESAHDFGIPRFQVERNVNSLKLLPLWGLDGRTANHGLIHNLLQAQVDYKIDDTTDRDICETFVPLLKLLVKGARKTRHTREEILKYSSVVLSIAQFFEVKDYNQTWNSPAVSRAWVEAWLCPYHEDPDIEDPASKFALEKPSLTDFRDALAIFIAYFFVFSVQPPDGEDPCPRVYQSTHHGISSLYGMILKYRKGVTFGIWDHAILWRETCLNISPAQCALSVPVQSMLLGVMGLAAKLAYFHADVLVPCASVFNPTWEVEIGSDQGRVLTRKQFSRRIEPIVNGISNMGKFTPADEVRTKTPHVVMLSNVQFIKDVKTAVLAAHVIVNVYGYKDYKLLVYGAQDRQPSYTLEMAKLIADKKLGEHVKLAGFGSPSDVLKDAWLFMNSSLSEGLPLAIGEAALAGVPVVATEVGSTALVMTDPDDPSKRYGEVVPPNDPVALARAQLSILCMVGPWAQFTSDANSENPPMLPYDITPSDVEWLNKRMYERQEDRRKLGLLCRSVVLRSFHGDRYLREHEQMYWIQWHTSLMREDTEVNEAGVTAAMQYGAAPVVSYVDQDLDSDTESVMSDPFRGGWSTPRKGARSNMKWQDFESSNGSSSDILSLRRVRGRATTRGPSMTLNESARHSRNTSRAASIDMSTRSFSSISRPHSVDTSMV